MSQRLIHILALATVMSQGSLQVQRWKGIGTTSSGNIVSVDPASVKRRGGLVSATVRVVFTTPVKAAKGTWASSKTSATFDCAKRSLAAREHVYYSDARSTRAAERTVNNKPLLGPAVARSPVVIRLE